MKNLWKKFNAKIRFASEHQSSFFAIIFIIYFGQMTLRLVQGSFHQTAFKTVDYFFYILYSFVFVQWIFRFISYKPKNKKVR